MGIPKESPCFDCVGVNDNPSACCWDLTLYISHSDTTNIQRFRDRGVPEYPAYFDKPDRRILTGSRFSIQGACPLLDQHTGECEVQSDNKPVNCRRVVPFFHGDCRDKRAGRRHR